MENIMAITDMHTRFPAEWLLIEDPQTDESLEVQSGKIIAHSKNRDDVYRRAVASRPKYFAIVYTGSYPKNTAIIL